jgi:hypothetical protein
MARKNFSLWDRRWSLSIMLTTAIMAVVALVTAVASGFPKPAAVPYRWELNFEPGDLRFYTDQSSGQAYWYFTYTVTNRTGKDQLWAPKMVVYTDRGEILEAGRDVPTLVTQNLLVLLGSKLLEDQNQIIGDLLQGKENAKEGLVIWKAGRSDVNEISLFVRGISGETARVKNPVNGQEINLYKTLQRDYLIPGDAAARGSQPIDLVQEQWILR